MNTKTVNFIDQVYPRRPGSHDWGRDYEIKFTALITLRCLGLKDTKDLWLGSNVDYVGDFDDVVLCRWTKDNLCNVYLIQLKHQDNPKNIEQRNFMYSSTTKKKKFKEDFSLAKYYSGYVALKENLCNGKEHVPEIIRILRDAHNIAFILATNRNVNRCDFLQNIDNADLDFLDTSQSSNNKFKFSPEKFNYDFEFMNQLFLFVNQMHVSELDRMIEKEVKKLLETSRTKNIASKFVAFMTNWSKGFGINEFYVLTKNDIINKLTDLLLDPYKFDFSKDLVTFYSDSYKSVWNQIVEDKVISLIDVDEGVFRFVKEFIGCEVTKQVVEPKTLWSDHLSNTAQKCFPKAKLLGYSEHLTVYDVYRWLWANSKLPLLLNINSAEDYEDILKIIKLSNYQFHFIMLIRGAVEITPKRFKKAKSLYCFHDLNETQQTKILSMSVYLQGRTSIKLQSLVNKNMYDFIKCRDIVNILLDGYKVGYEYNCLPSYCITPFLFRIILKYNVLKELADEIFVVDSTVDKIPWDLPNVYTDTSKFLELQDEYDSVHRLFFHESGQLEWKESFGSTRNIRKYQLIDKGKSSATDNILWGSFECLTNSVHVISAIPGMGKSMLIDYVAAKCSNPVWVLKIDLNEHEDYTDIKYFDHFNLKMYDCANPELSKLVFEHLLRTKKILVLLDGFDEIFISHKDNVINFAKQLINDGMKVWLTTRPFAESLLEDEFDTISANLKPLDRIEQQTFLTEYFKVPNCQAFVEKLLKATEENLSDLEFMGVPLQLKLLADVFGKDAEQGTVEFNCRFNLARLYGEFFKQKADILCVKYGKGAKEMRILFDKVQTLYALKIILPHLYSVRLDIIGQLAQCCQNDRHSLLFLQREGVVVLESETQILSIKFVHRTFASYLVAKWLVENLHTNVGAAKCILTFFSNSYYRFEFRMFNCIVVNDCSLHMALTMGRIEEAKALIKSDPRTIRAIDKCGRSVIHIIVIHGVDHDDYDDDELENIVDEMVEVMERIPDKKIKDVVDYVGYRAIDYAIEGHRMAVANKLSEKIQNVSICVPIYGDISFFRYCFTMGYKSLFNRVILPYFASQDLLLENLGDQAIRTYCVNLVDLDNFDEYINDLNAETILDLFRSKTGYHNAWIAAAFGTETDVSLLLENLDLNKKDSNGFTLLHYAARHGKLEIVKLLISKKIDVDVLSIDGETPLYCAAKMGHYDIVIHLLSKGAQVDIQTNYGDTPLLAALMDKRLNIAGLLISKGADVTAGRRNDKTNLHYAIEAGDYDIVNYIISKGVDVNQKTNFNETPLLLACRYNHQSIAKLFLENEANIAERDYYGSSPLHYAATIEDIDLMLALIAKGCVINTQNNCGETPLLFAIKYKNLSAVKYLLNCDANVNLGHDENGWTSLHHAASINDVDLVLQLYSKGAKLGRHNKNEETPLFVAILNKAMDVAKFLISKSALIEIKVLLYMASFGENELLSEVLSKVIDVNERNTFGESALLLALRYNRLLTAQILLSFGVDNGAKNIFKQNPLHYIIKYAVFCNEDDVNKQITIANVLLNCESNINDQDYEGYAPFHVFAGKVDEHKMYPILFEKFQDELFKSFVDHGCDVNLKNKMGESALELAVALENAKFVSMFGRFFYAS